ARVPCPRRTAVPRGDRTQPPRGRAALPDGPAHRGLREPPGAPAALDRAVPARAAGRGRPGHAQRGARARDPGRRSDLPRVGADRRRGLAASVFRELPDDRRGRPGDRPRPPRARAAPGGGGGVSDDQLLPAERKVLEVLGDRPFDFRAMWAVSNLFRATAAIRRHMEANVLGPDRLSWTSFV